ncbi:MAG: RNA methyltransferase [Lachnospiraceae bacterium]|nr:RNA methyltransferase [Lachnospiraceae bacterium]
MRISSPSNEKIKAVIQLQTKASVRKKKKLFIVEGIKMYEEIPESDIELTYVSEKFYEEYIKREKISDNVKKRLNTKEYIIVSDPIFKNMSDTVTPQGILAIVKQKKYELSDILDKTKNQVFMVLEGVQDPGNMGTIIRTGEGAGIAGIIVNKETVDVYNPKVIRSTMGSIYRVPIVTSEDLGETLDYMSENGVTLFAAHLKGDAYYTDGQFSGSIAFLIGNEANGLSEEISKKAHKLIKIPMEGEVESLNASVAAAILMYEAKRQCSS